MTWVKTPGIIRPMTAAPAPFVQPVTVAIPCYNPDPQHLSEAVRSALASTLPPAEVLLIDDGSTRAESLAAIRGWAGHPTIRVITHAENRGLAAARNTGMAEARTDLVLQLDADDRIDPTFIEKAVWALACHPEWSFVNAWVRAFGAKEYLWTRGFEAGRDFLADNQTNPIAVIRRAADRAIGGHTEAIRGGMEDWDYWLKMAAHGFWGGTIAEVLLHYRIHPQATFWPNRDDPQKRQRFRRELRERYPDLWKHGIPRLKPAEATAKEPDAFGPIPVVGSARPRLLLIVPWLALGGADRFNLNLTQQLTQRGWHVTIATTIEHPDPWRETFATHTPDLFSLPKFLTPELQPAFLKHLIRSRSIDAVMISNSMLGYACLPYLRAHCPDTAFLDYNHMVVTEWLNGGFTRIGAENQQSLDLNLVNAQQVKGWMVDQGAEADRIDVVYMGQDCTVLDPARYARSAARTRFGLVEDVPALLFPARLEPQKRPRFLLEILERLKRDGQRFICLIAGDGPQRGLVESAIRRLHLEDVVHLLGSIPAEEMPALYAASDVVLLPTQNEGIALAVYEGMAMRLPVVAAAVGGQPELVTDETGYLIPLGEHEREHYVGAVAELLSDPARRAAMGAAGRQRIEAVFNIQATTDHFVSAVQRAIALNASAPRPRLEATEAQQLARRVADDIRHERLQERLRGGRVDLAHVEASGQGRWRGWVYIAKKRVFRPIYYWAIRHGFDFIIPLTGRIYKSLHWLLK